MQRCVWYSELEANPSYMHLVSYACVRLSRRARQGKPGSCTDTGADEHKLSACQIGSIARARQGWVGLMQSLHSDMAFSESASAIASALPDRLMLLRLTSIDLQTCSGCQVETPRRRSRCLSSDACACSQMLYHVQACFDLSCCSICMLDTGESLPASEICHHFRSAQLTTTRSTQHCQISSLYTTLQLSNFPGRGLILLRLLCQANRSSM